MITLKVNELKTPIKTHRVTKWIKKQDPSICCLQETHLKPKDMHRLKVKGWEKIFHANNREKKADVAVVSDKIQFKTENVTKDKEGHYIMKRVSPTRGYNHYKYICTQHRSTNICEKNTNRVKGGNRMQCSHFRRLQHATHPKG